jgi:hypothetical protein
MGRPLRAECKPSNTEHATDTLDTIERLVHNVPESNVRVGTLGMAQLPLWKRPTEHPDYDRFPGVPRLSAGAPHHGADPVELCRIGIFVCQNDK